MNEGEDYRLPRPSLSLVAAVIVAEGIDKQYVPVSVILKRSQVTVNFPGTKGINWGYSMGE